MGWLNPIYPDGLEKIVSTPDDWCPNYPEDKIKVIINNLNFTSQETSIGKFRVIVEGQDDLLMTKDNMTAEEAISIFNRIKDGITFEKLKEMCETNSLIFLNAKLPEGRFFSTKAEEENYLKQELPHL